MPRTHRCAAHLALHWQLSREMHFAHACTLHDFHHVVRIDATSRSDHESIACALNHRIQSPSAIERKGLTTGAEHAMNTEVEANIECKEHFSRVIDGAVESDLALGRDTHRLAHERHVRSTRLRETASHQPQRATAEHLCIDQDGMRLCPRVHETAGRGPDEHAYWNFHSAADRIHQTIARGDAPTGQPSADLHAIGAARFGGFRFMHRSHTDLNLHPHAANIHDPARNPLCSRT